MANDDPNKQYDYSHTPAYRRKLRREQRRKANDAAFLDTQGPVTMILFYLLDFVYNTGQALLFMLLNFTGIGFDYFYQFFYRAYGGLIPNAEKFGHIVSFKVIRYIITFVAPPLGVYLSKGLFGWFNIITCFILTYINFFAGVIYAFVITFRNRYADRYEKKEYERLMAIRAYINSCTGKSDEIEKLIDKDSKAILMTILFLILMFGLFFYAFNYM